MKVLFLDMDGVCNSSNWAMQGNSYWLGVDPAAAALVQRIIKETGCKVVLSSTWRMYKEAREAVRQKVCDYIDYTINMQDGEKRGVVDRGYEVREWLQRHPWVKQYAILDDDADFFPDQWLFKTKFETGITEDIADAVINHLNAGDNRYASNSI